LQIRINLTIRAPLGWKNLSKDGIRSKHVTVESADWDLAQFFCGCESPTKPKAPVRGPRTGRRPGKRWTKGLVPTKADPLTKKNHPRAKKSHKTCKRKKPRSNG
jgi:hypothetical protein